MQAMASDGHITVSEAEDGNLLFLPDNPQSGLIFYPGGKVEYTAYAPLMRACAQRGIFCVLLKMPWNLAVLDVNAADGITQQYPDIDAWYLGGHSLGGAMAANYAASHSGEFDGLILLVSRGLRDLWSPKRRWHTVHFQSRADRQDRGRNMEHGAKQRTTFHFKII